MNNIHFVAFAISSQGRLMKFNEVKHLNMVRNLDKLTRSNQM